MFCWCFFPRVISELCQTIVAKFCTILGSVFSFIIPIQNFEGPPKKIRGQNMQNLAGFRTTKRMKIFKIGKLFDLPRFLSRSSKKMR